MNTPASSAIKQVLSAFENITTLCESQVWAKNANPEDIKAAFKLGNFVEKSVVNFKEKKCLNDFLATFNKNRRGSVCYDEEFFGSVCDQVLLKFFRCRTVGEATLDMAVRMYTSLFPQDRLQKALKELLMTSACFDATIDFVIANKGRIDIDELRYKLVMDEWCEGVKKDSDSIKAHITEAMSTCKVESSLHILIGILALNAQNNITDLVLTLLLEKMLDRSLLSKTFWLSLFKKVDRNTLGKACEKHKTFLASLCNFIVYIGSMMEMDEAGEWAANPNTSLVPEITYSEIEGTIEVLCGKNGDIKETVLARLQEAETLTESSIWSEIRYKLS